MSRTTHFAARFLAAAPSAVLPAICFVLALALPVSNRAAAAAMTGAATPVVTFQANFDGDTSYQPPNTTLPGSPEGDFLTLDTACGSIKVVPSYYGLTKPVQIRQSKDPGAVTLIGHTAPTPAPPVKATVQWRALAKDEEETIRMAMVVRASNGAILSSLEFLRNRGLSCNDVAGAGLVLPAWQIYRTARLYAIEVDFLTQTTKFTIDGIAVPGFEAVPFAHPGDDIATIEIGGKGGHPQTIYVDDISVVEFCRPPDSAPVVLAPSSVLGEEGSPMSFTVTASDPDGDAIATLADAGAPSGAAFTPNGTNTSGAFAWTPDFTQAGSYSVTFTASNALSASAATLLEIANHDRVAILTAPETVAGAEGAAVSFSVTVADPDGDAITALTASGVPEGASFTADSGNENGTFAWTPGFSQAGSYSLTFTAASGALSASATTALVIADTDRTPVVTAPSVEDGEEGGILIFSVSVTDPDGEPVAGLAADLTGLPSGHSASFTPDDGNLSGTFTWPMKHGEAGTYYVTFTASNGSSGSATTKINVAINGTMVTGEFIWTPQPGEEGTYAVTFTARNNLGETGAATTTLVITPADLVTTPHAGGASVSLRGVSLAPDRALKGPIVHATQSFEAPVGTTVTVNATALEGGTALAVSIARAGSVVQSPGAVGSIVSFDADRSALPSGNNSAWVVDQDPIVTAPDSIAVYPGAALGFTVSASDPDGDPIMGLSADQATALPSGNTATFTTNGSKTLGTFSWTPRLEDSGTFTVTFTAFNRLVMSASTTITVREVAAARISTEWPKSFWLILPRPYWCVQIEPVDESFSVTDVDPASIRMVSIGTGSVSEISAIGSKHAVICDRDEDDTLELEACFSKGDLRALFSLVRVWKIVPVTVCGRLVNGQYFEGSMNLSVITGFGSLHTAMSPNPLNPTGTLRFITTKPGRIRVALYDAQGRFIRTLRENTHAAAGEQEITIDGRGGDGRSLASGVYFYHIEAPDGAESGRFTILK